MLHKTIPSSVLTFVDHVCRPPFYETTLLLLDLGCKLACWQYQSLLVHACLYYVVHLDSS